MTRAALEAQWLKLTRETLPALAAARNWPIRNDHCFQRVLLDAACGGCWYASITKRPAYRHATESVLRSALDIGQQLVDNSADLSALNRQSLSYRK